MYMERSWFLLVEVEGRAEAEVRSDRVPVFCGLGRIPQNYRWLTITCNTCSTCNTGATGARNSTITGVTGATGGFTGDLLWENRLNYNFTFLKTTINCKIGGIVALVAPVIFCHLLWGKFTSVPRNYNFSSSATINCKFSQFSLQFLQVPRPLINYR